MPRGRGGKRAGNAGTAYSNRTDLNEQPVRTAPSKQYGSRAAQERAQEAVPLPQQSSGNPGGGGAAGAPGEENPFPGALPIVPLGAPTNRPDEPYTAGAPFGAGPGPEALGNGVEDQLHANLRALFRAYPIPEIADLIAESL